MGKQKIIKRIDEIIVECQDENHSLGITTVEGEGEMVTLYEHKLSMERWEKALNEIKSLLWKG